MLEHSTFRFSEAAGLAGMTPKTLRNWLQRGEVTLYSEAPSGRGWRSFELRDVILLAVTRALADFGILVEQANFIAFSLLRDPEPWFNTAVKDGEQTFTFDCDRAVYLWPFGPGWDCKSFRLSKPGPWHLSHRGIVLQLPALIAEVVERANDLGTVGVLA